MWNTSDGDPTISFTSNDVSLENFLSPFSYGQETPLPAFQPGAAIHTQNSRGFISQDCQWGCCWCRNSIKCFPVDSYGTSGQYVSKGHVPVTISTTSYSFQSSSITCATELAIHNHKTVLGIRKILLGLKVREDEDLVGALVIFDPVRCLPMKWISLPSPVSSVTVLSHYEETGFVRPFFNEAMLTMVGVAAVGMQGGRVVIVDLGLDDPNLSSWDCVLTPGVLKYHIMPVDPHELLIATKRHNVVTRNNLICVDLISENEEESENESDYYYYCSPERTVLCTLEQNSISVTCLEYIPAIGSLIVGYSFGCFQIWGVDSAALLYSSPVPSAEVTNEVFGFAFQQPVDDPKNICYLWVLFGKQTLEMHYSHAELYGLLYNNKPHSENFGHIYEDFIQCSRRLSIRMEDYFDTASENDDSMEDRRCPLQRYSVRPIRIWNHSDRLTFFSWESNRNGIYYVGIFDLNQWYSNHASDKVKYSEVTSLCPYWVAIPVETVDRFATVWDVGVVPKSIESWENPHSKLDLHLYPASITFRGVCLTSSGTSTFEFFGLQEKLLRILQKKGPDMMVEPGEFRHLCQMYGLEPVMSHRYDDLASKLDADRYFILSVLLESRRSSFILEMANKWIDGSYVNVGCSVDLILGWVSSFTCAIRSIADQHWENLLFFRNEVLPPETAHFINYSNFIWHALLGVLDMLMKPNEIYESQADDLENLKFLLEKLVQYSAALLMFYKAGILPEVDEHQFVPMMLKYYEQRRNDVKGALQNCDLLDPEIKSSHTLLIDYLLENFNEQLLRKHWNLEPEESLYPPKHIGYILNMFMWAHEYPKAIARIIAYYLIDLSSIINDTVKLRGDFASIIQLSTEEQTEIYNLWALDHGACHEVLLFLSQKDRLHESDGLPWCAAVVLLTALGHGESIVELLQKSCPSKLGRLYFNLMSTSRTKYNFLIDDICSTPALMESSHLQNFFEVSDKHNLLGEFVKAKSCSAPAVVTDALVEYLQSHSNFENCDRLLSYYVHKEDWGKLREQYDSVKTQSYLWKLTKPQRSVWQVRQMLVESLLKPTRQDFQKFASDKSPQIAHVSGPPRRIKIQHVQRPYSFPSPLNKFRANNNGAQEIKLPPQLRNLKLHVAKSTCCLSPMRGQSGFLHAVIGVSEGNDKSSTPKSVRDHSIAPIRILSSSPDTPSSNSLSVRKSFRSTSRISLGGRSPINLIALLKTPAVDHRVSRTSRNQGGETVDVLENDDSVYGTPCSDQTSTTGVQSIMKKHDSLRRFVCRKGLRFSESTFRSREGSHEDSDDEANDEHIPLDIQKLSGVAETPQLDETVDDPLNQNINCSDDEANDEHIPLDIQKLSDVAETQQLDETVDDTLNQNINCTDWITEESVVNDKDINSELEQQSLKVEALEEEHSYKANEIMKQSTVKGEGKNSELNEPILDVDSDSTKTNDLNRETSFTSSPPLYKTRSQERRRSCTPDSEISFQGSTGDLSEKAITRSQARKESEFGVSGNEGSSIFEATLEEYPKSSIGSRRGRTARNVRSRSKTPLPVLPVVQEDAELKIERLVERNVRSRSKTPLAVLPVEQEDAELKIERPVERNVRSRSKTPLAVLPVEQEDAELKIERPVDIQKLSDVAETPQSDETVDDPPNQNIKCTDWTTEESVVNDKDINSELEQQSLKAEALEEEHSYKANEIMEQSTVNGEEEQKLSDVAETSELDETVDDDPLNQNINCTDWTTEESVNDKDINSELEQQSLKVEALDEEHSYKANEIMEQSTVNGEGENSELNEAILDVDSDSTKTNDLNSETSFTSSPPLYMTRSQSRRRSCTPDSEISFRGSTGDLSEKRITRSQARKESEFDVSGNEGSSIFDATLEESPKSSIGSRRGRTARNVRSRSKTPLPLLPVVQEDAELKIERLVERNVRSRSKTPLAVLPVEQEDAEQKIERHVERNVRSRSKTPLAVLPVVQEDTELKIETHAEAPVVKEKTTKRKERKPKEPKTPVKDKTPPNPGPGPASKKSSKTKLKANPPAETEIVKQKRKTTKRKSMYVEEKTPEPEDDSSADEGTTTKPVNKRKRRQLHAYDYTPGLSTIVEDSDQSLSIFQATQVNLSPPVLSPPKSRGKRTPRSTPTKSVVAAAAGLGSGGKEKSTRRRKNDLESDDDTKSDISATSSRSIRSTSTPELSILVESDQSFLGATLTEPPRLPTPRKTRGRSKEPTVSPTKSIDEVVVDKVKPTKRRKKDTAESDDDAQSDISVASSRSTRSTASRRSTERSLPKRTTRSSKK